MRPAEPQELDGNERPLLGGADQLRRQPQRGRISGADRLLRGLLSLRGDSSDVSLYCTGHLPRHLALLLYLHSGVPGARYIRHQGASHNRKPRFRTGVSGPDEYPGMDADFPTIALVVRDLCQRSHRSRDRPGLDRRPHSLYDRIFASGRKTRPGFWDSGDGDRDSLGGRPRRHHLASHSCITIEAGLRAGIVTGPCFGRRLICALKIASISLLAPASAPARAWAMAAPQL